MNDTFELILLGAVVALILFKINHPEVRWRCLVGKHKYCYIGNKSGMYFNEDTKEIVGTMRKIYQCSCSKYKKAEDKDWI